LPNRRCLSEDRGDDAMNEPTMETLARRLDRVERENRRLKRSGVVALAVIAAVGLMGQATKGKVAKVIEAEKFIVRDASGKVRGVLGAHEDTVVFGLYDMQEKTRLVLFMGPDGSPGIAVYDRRGSNG